MTAKKRERTKRRMMTIENDEEYITMKNLRKVRERTRQIEIED